MGGREEDAGDRSNRFHGWSGIVDGAPLLSSTSMGNKGVSSSQAL